MAAFSPIIVGTQQFVSVNGGRYIDLSLPLGSPRDEFKIAPGSITKAKARTGGLTRLFELDVLSNVNDPQSTVVRRRAIVSTQLTADAEIGADVLRELMVQSTGFLTVQHITMLMNGAS